MKRTTFFLLVIALYLLFVAQAMGAKPAGVDFHMLGCEIHIPSGYILSPDGQGNIRGSFEGKNHLAYPHFQYYPKDSMEEHVSNSSIYVRVIAEEKIGDLRFFRVQFDLKSSPNLTWDVVTSNSEFFAAWGVPDSKFLEQFRKCAQD